MTEELKPYKILVEQNPEDRKQLRKRSSQVPPEEITTKEFRTFLEKLRLTLKESESDLEEGFISVGLAAPQVGIRKRVFLALDNNSEEVITYINPKLKLLGQVRDIRAEYCLSIPGESGEVARHKRIQITYMDHEGREQKKKFSGFNARLIQHEFDHLEGILFIDRLKTN
ncbi:peptide deformylase [Candidatus Dojkabacteria bacterium]|nr:peptide deformylase [Candidatus Dojkabacteria bacterium]